MIELSRSEYSQLFGPTTGDQVRLADTDLFIQITEDRCVGGNEVVFGGGKVIRSPWANPSSPAPIDSRTERHKHLIR